MTKIIDSHVHVGITKYRPVEELVTVLDDHGVGGAVLVQYQGNFDNEYLRQCLHRYPGRFAALAMLNLADPSARRDLEKLASAGFGGLRIRGVEVSSRAADRGVWSALEDHGLVASIAGEFDVVTADVIEKLVERHPRVTFRLEHLGGPDVAESPPYHRYNRLLRFAAYPNVVTMLSAFYSYSRRPYPYEDTLTFAAMAFEAFGAGRCLWGSDWPPIDDHEGYARALDFARRLPFIGSESERNAVLGGAAASLWRFELP